MADCALDAPSLLKASINVTPKKEKIRTYNGFSAFQPVFGTSLWSYHLPNVRAAIHVQHLPRNLPGVC